jgi:uncharacterized integral membrane protein
MQLGFIFVLIISIIVAIFAIQNGALVVVDLFFFQLETPLAVVMMVCLIIGAIIVLVLGAFRHVKKVSESKELKNKIKAFENEKIQFESNIKTMETEIQNLKGDNDLLTSKVTVLQEKNDEQVEKIVDLSEKLKNNESVIDKVTLEGASSELNDEKSEVNS